MVEHRISVDVSLLGSVGREWQPQRVLSGYTLNSNCNMLHVNVCFYVKAHAHTVTNSEQIPQMISGKYGAFLHNVIYKTIHAIET